MMEISHFVQTIRCKIAYWYYFEHRFRWFNQRGFIIRNLNSREICKSVSK